MTDAAVAPTTDLGWMQLQSRALYRHDARGRIAAGNARPGEEGTPPLFFLGRTRQGALWRFSDRLPEPIVTELSRLAAAEILPEDLERDPERLPTLLERLAPVQSAPVLWRGPAFRFPEVLPSPEGVERLDAADLAAVTASFPDFDRRGAPFFAAREGGRVVSICYDATGPGPAVEAGVQTLPEARGRGLASRVVVAWARATREAGRIPLYSTSWDNAASRGVARRLGLILYGSDLNVR